MFLCQFWKHTGRHMDETEGNLVFCHEAMHVQMRMQDAGWSADVERWETDEESDGSEEECDADETQALQLSDTVVLRLTA